jgi:hypothetical protein
MKELGEVKMQLPPKSGNVWSPLSDSDEHVGLISTSFGRNLIRQHSTTVARCCRIPAPSVFQWPNIAGF